MNRLQLGYMFPRFERSLGMVCNKDRGLPHVKLGNTLIYMQSQSLIY